ncbi:MAG: MopE-related protein [Myxococcota bacterium]
MIALLLACAPPPEEETVCDVRYVDADGDGFGGEETCGPPGVSAGGDCDDGDAGVFPGAPEDCTSALDRDCDGRAGDADADRDGLRACEDCDDDDATVFPDAEEVCDGKDQDCDGEVDEGLALLAWYTDVDGDGYGVDEVLACAGPEGTADLSGDCDDTDPDVNPGAEERCDDADVDEDCDGEAEEAGAAGRRSQHRDADGDGYGSAGDWVAACETPEGYLEENREDCDDGDPSIHPEGVEVCDGVDQDCDDTVDEDAVDPRTWYADADGDGFGDPATTALACDSATDWLADASDCDDTDAGVYPGATETCDERDEDCDGSTDESGATGESRWFLDADGDGYGDVTAWVDACAAPSGYVDDRSDCDDADARNSPAADEHCDGHDENCDGVADDGGVDGDTWYTDADGDGFGDPSSPVVDCTQPAGTSADGSDCDDGDATVSPDGEETCDGVDEDCDGTADDAAADAAVWYADDDGDGFGDASTSRTACEAPSGYVDDATDCDDGRDDVHPRAPEADCADPFDYNCDGSVGVTDADGDGAVACDDCDDADATAYPGAADVCDGVDDDCDGEKDEDVAATDWYADADGDGYGDASAVFSRCDAPSGHVSDATDCDDTTADVSPGAVEVWGNGVDDDCDGEADLQALADVGFTLTGEASMDLAGGSVAFAGDLDGDGDDEVLVGAEDSDGAYTDGGAVYVVLAPVTGDLSLASADARWLGDSAGDEAGDALASAGDVDGDGLPDVLVGAPSDDDGAVGAGAAYLLTTMGSGDEDLAGAAAKLTGAASGDRFGSALDRAGDVDGDGGADLLVGAYAAEVGGLEVGAAYVFLGPVAGTVSASAADARLYGEDRYDSAGGAVAGGEDVDGDGLADLAVGAAGAGGASDYGRVYVVYGPVAGDVDLAGSDVVIEGRQLHDYFGGAVALAPDDDGDGYADLLVGATENGREGAAYVFEGPLSATTTAWGARVFIDGTVGTNTSFGSEVAPAGDLDADGADDLVVSDPGADHGAWEQGAVYVFLGPAAGTYEATDADVILTGDGLEDGAGVSVDAGGDSDGDGVPDLLVGAASWSSSTAGSAYLVLGP